ncbi:Ubiquitin specific peptidase [Balamuthia mandrillaris]
MSSATRSKGLVNKPGQNNCFLNVCIQALWHLDSFRAKFVNEGSHVHRGSSCIYCALKQLFKEYQFSESETLPPTALRTCLAILYQEEDRFRLGDLDDAAEALEAILTCLNKVYLINGQSKIDEYNPESISNKVFGIPILERIQCKKCDAVSQPYGSDLFIYYAYVTEVISGSKRYPSLSFDRLLKRLSSEERKSCPNEESGLCKEKKCPVYKYLLQQPEVFAIGLVWVTPNPTVQEITDMLSLIDARIRLSNIFEGVPVQFTYALRGMVCYYGMHYDCYFYSAQRRKWMVFDDTVVKEVGDTWEALTQRCRRGHFHPSVLFYERVEKNEKPLPSQICGDKDASSLIKKAKKRAQQNTTQKVVESSPKYPSFASSSSSSMPTILPSAQTTVSHSSPVLSQQPTPIMPHYNNHPHLQQHYNNNGGAMYSLMMQPPRSYQQLLHAAYAPYVLQQAPPSSYFNNVSTSSSSPSTPHYAYPYSSFPANDNNNNSSSDSPTEKQLQQQREEEARKAEEEKQQLELQREKEDRERAEEEARKKEENARQQQQNLLDWESDLAHDPELAGLQLVDLPLEPFPSSPSFSSSSSFIPSKDDDTSMHLFAEFPSVPTKEPSVIAAFLSSQRSNAPSYPSTFSSSKTTKPTKDDQDVPSMIHHFASLNVDSYSSSSKSSLDSSSPSALLEKEPRAQPVSYSNLGRLMNSSSSSSHNRRSTSSSSTTKTSNAVSSSSTSSYAAKTNHINPTKPKSSFSNLSSLLSAP